MAYQAQTFPVYQPAMRIIASISNANPAVVTTTFAHQYLTGTIVRLNFPPGYGMEQANQLTGEIVVTGSTTFSINIDTTFFDPFMIPATFPDDTQYAQVVPIGENSLTLRAATVNSLPYSAT
jgi:hypothetical protein